MKKSTFFLISVLTFILSVGWLADRGWKVRDTELVIGTIIQFNNQNTGWHVHPAFRDTVFKTTDGGLNWIGYLTPDTNRMSGLFFVNNNTGWVVGQRGKIAKSTSGGTTWNFQNTGIQSWLNSVHFYDAATGFTVGSNDSNRVILKTTTGGAIWQILVRNNQSRLYSVYMTGPQSVYCVGDSGAVIYSSNGGTNWINQSSGTSATLREIVFKNYGSSEIGWIAGLNGTILRTSNGGANWLSRSFNTVNFYGIDFGSYDTGYVCGRGRIYKTINNGLNWFQQTTPVPDTINIKDIFCINSQNAWAVPYSGTLLYTTNGGVIGIWNISSEIPAQYTLSQNYPNPFNPNTKIRFAIPKQNYVKLSIYDVTGRVMAVLVNEELKPGTYEVDWDASHRASGIYYYKLETDGFAETKRMVVVKQLFDKMENFCTEVIKYFLK